MGTMWGGLGCASVQKEIWNLALFCNYEPFVKNMTKFLIIEKIDWRGRYDFK